MLNDLWFIIACALLLGSIIAHVMHREWTAYTLLMSALLVMIIHNIVMYGDILYWFEAALAIGIFLFRLLCSKTSPLKVRK